MGQTDDRRLSSKKPQQRRPVGRAALGEKDEFVRLEVTEEHKPDLLAFRADTEQVLEALQREIENGYKFTFRWDDYSSSPAVFMFPGDDSDNRGYILSGRGSTVYRALSETLFKHLFLLRGVWGAGQSRRAGADDPDW